MTLSPAAEIAHDIHVNSIVLSGDGADSDAPGKSEVPRAVDESRASLRNLAMIGSEIPMLDRGIQTTSHLRLILAARSIGLAAVSSCAVLD